MKDNIPKEPLIALIREIDSKLNRKIDLYAVGGTAMTLLDLKASTQDVDFNLKPEDYEEFIKAKNKVVHGYRIDVYQNGAIFTQQLPEDYIDKSIPINIKFEKINLYSIHPLDIVVTKIGRLNERDFEDISDCIKKYHLKKKDIESRGKKVIYAGNEDNYLYNLKDILTTCFHHTKNNSKR